MYQVVTSLDALFQPFFNLNRIVEHAMIRGKDTVVFHRPPPGQEVSHLALLHLDDFSLRAANPRVKAIDLGASGTADGIRAAALAPLIVARKSSVAELFLRGPPASERTAAATHAGSQAKQLAALVQERLIEAGKPVYALEEDFCLDASTPEGVMAANALYALLAKAAVVTDAGGGGPAAQALMEVTEAAKSLGIISRGDEGIEALVASCSANKKTFLEFFASNWKPSAAAATAAGPSSPMRTVRMTGDSSLPDRFADPTTRRHNPRQQHPVYQTTSNDYGLKKPQLVEMPDTYHGSSQYFSNTFYGGPSKVSCMVTSITTSKVHEKLNDF